MNYVTYRDLGINGRLGNQLFQIAATIAFAKRINAVAMFPEWEYNKYFKPFAAIGNMEPNFHYHEPSFSHMAIDWNDAQQVNNPHGNKILNLHGYFQSEKYFDHCKRLILDAFEPTYSPISDLKNKFSETTCSIHVRRGDYVGNDYYAQLDGEYYNAAIDYIQEHTNTSRFIVFSDDIEFCKEMFKGDKFTLISGLSDIEDLFYMSYCSHNIGANSSFSWWANYLNKNAEKISIFPKKWFGPSANLDTKDLYTKNMILL